MEPESDPLDIYRSHLRSLASEAIESLIDSVNGFEPYAERLRDLVDMAVDEYPDTLIPSVVSITTLSRFINVFPQQRQPTISLTPSGGLWLSWIKEHVRAALFIARDGQASFGLVSKSFGQRPLHFNLSGAIEQVAEQMLTNAKVVRVLSD